MDCADGRIEMCTAQRRRQGRFVRFLGSGVAKSKKEHVWRLPDGVLWA